MSTTPRPWTVKDMGEGHYRVGADHPTRNACLSFSNLDADLIVRAVNAYDELVAAFEKIDAFLTDVETSNPGYLGKLVLQDYMQFNEAMIARTKAKAALARAGKGE